MTALLPLFGRRSGWQDPSVPLSADSLLDFLYNSGDTTRGGYHNASGVYVNEQTSMQMSSVFRCVSVTSGVCAALPLQVFEADTKNRVPSRLLRNPHPEMTRLELWKLTYVHRLLWGDASLQKIRNGAGQVVELWPISPWRVRIGRVKSSNINPGGKIFEVTDDDGQIHPMTSREILHIPGLTYDGVCGISPIRQAAHQAIGLAIAAERSGAKFFARGAQLGGVLQVEQRLEDNQAEALQRRWEARTSGIDNAHKVAILDSNAKFQPITMPLKDAQFLETRQFQVPEIARFFGVPLFLLFETAKSTSWGTGLEQQAQGWVIFDLQPTWLAPTEQRITKELLPDTREARYNVNGLMRGDSAARGAFYNVMRNVGAYSANDIRDLENLEPVDGGDTYLQPLNMAPLGTEPPPPAPAQPPPDPNGDPNAGN